MSVSDSIKKGSVDILLLTLLKEEDKYGYQLCQEIAERSNNRYVLKESSMYPMLYRLIDKNFISDRQVIVGKRRKRVYYHIEPAGLEYLDKIVDEYISIVNGILNILGKEEIK